MLPPDIIFSCHEYGAATGQRLLARARDGDTGLDGSLTDGSYRAFRLPALLLAEYRDGDLRCVTPHHDGDGLRRVGDRLDQLATGDPTTFEPLAQTAPLAPTVTVDTEPGTDGTDAEDSAPLQQR